jgi:hypothetical protein
MAKLDLTELKLQIDFMITLVAGTFERYQKALTDLTNYANDFSEYRTQVINHDTLESLRQERDKARDSFVTDASALFRFINKANEAGFKVEVSFNEQKN